MFHKRSKGNVKKKLIDLGIATKEALAVKRGKRKPGIELNSMLTIPIYSKLYRATRKGE
jgi:hypothetical protein